MALEKAPNMPAQVGRYQLLGPLGVGGMASVYLALVQGAAGFRREVALKVLHPHLIGDSSLVRQFLAEARVCSRIRHPNVVPVIDVAEDEANVYLVMDFVEGDSLSGLRRLAREQGTALPQAVWLRMLCDALAGLHAAHELKEPDGTELGLVHRDFTPQNILLGLDGVARLSDFGIAKMAATPSHTVSGVIKGKVNYMAPEQVRGDTLDRRCDVWAAGVLAWEMATGRRLRKGRDANIQTLLEIVDAVPPKLVAVVPGFSHELSEVIASALVLDVDARCASAAEFRRRLMAAAPLAEHEECAEWVQRLAAVKIRERREKLGQVKQLRDQLASLLVEEPPSQSSSLPAASFAATLAEQTGQTRSTSSVETRESRAPRRSLRGVWITAALAVAASSAGLFVAFDQRVESSLARWPDSGAWARSVAVAQAADEPGVERQLVVQANAKITMLSLDGRATQLKTPSSVLKIPLPEWAKDRKELQVDAIAESGVRVSGLWQGKNPMRLAFPAAAPARRPSSGPTAPPKPGKKPLAKNPYDR